jgi:hypothetical protein
MIQDDSGSATLSVGGFAGDQERAMRVLFIGNQSNFGQPTVFVDPRRIMLGIRVNLGR